MSIDIIAFDNSGEFEMWAIVGRTRESSSDVEFWMAWGAVLCPPMSRIVAPCAR